MLLPITDWTARAAAHQQRVGPWADAFVDRRSRNAKHPVDDFLFTYYNFSPAKLKQWMPALGESLIVDEPSLEAHPWLCSRWSRIDDGVLSLDASLMDEAIRRAARFVVSLSEQILARPARLRCFGLHEWAMVYQLTPEEVRHNGWQLRLSPEELQRFIESQTICCSHYDAFRFFTPGARPLNTLQPTLETRLDNEQGACLHANMDLYKWAYKLWPWCGSDLIADAFCLAMEGRDLDMRASPYELRDLGYEPVLIETEAGRAQYQAEQQQLAAKAIPVRQQLRTIAAQICATPALPAQAGPA
jgi:hypothetical protein